MAARQPSRPPRPPGQITQCPRDHLGQRGWRRLAAVVFATLTEDATACSPKTPHPHPWLPFISPPAAVGLLWLTWRYFVRAEGSGILQVIAEMERLAHLPLAATDLAAHRCRKLLLGVTAVGAGFSFGGKGRQCRSVPDVASIARFLPAGLQLNRRHLVVAGGAAGLAAAFNAPLAGSSSPSRSSRAASSRA